MHSGGRGKSNTSPEGRMSIRTYVAYRITGDEKEKGAARKRSETIGNLLGHQITAEGDTVVQRHSGKIGAAAALPLGPRADIGKHSSEGEAQEIQKLVVRMDETNRKAVFAALRTELDEFEDAVEIVTAHAGINDTGDVAGLHRKHLRAGRGDDRAAVENEELQQGNQRSRENESGDHRCVTTSRLRREEIEEKLRAGSVARRAGTRRASAGVRSSV